METDNRKAGVDRLIERLPMWAVLLVGAAGVMISAGVWLFDAWLRAVVYKWWIGAIIVAALLTASCATAAAPPKPGDHTFTISHGGIERFYEVHVPRKAKPREGWPVVLLFHGGGSYPAMVRWESKFDSVADAQGFVVVAPAGTLNGKAGKSELTWNDGRLFKNGTASLVDDVGFVRAVLSDVGGRMEVDRRRQFAAGYSNGAQFTYRLVKQAGDEIAAIGTVAGQRGPDDLFPSPRAVSVIQFSGMVDTIAPYMGGAPSIDQPWITILRPAREVATDWARFDKCFTYVGSKRGKAECMDFRNASGNAVEFWTLNDGGHTWPGGNVSKSLAKTLGPVNRDVFAADEMWRFFAAHPLKTK